LDELMGQNFEKIQRSSTLYLLKVTEKHKISQRAVDDIVYHSRSLVDDVITQIKVGIHSKLASAGVNYEDIPNLEDVFTQLSDPFDGIETCYKKEKYYKESLGLIVN
jgi:hypothetical protein